MTEDERFERWIERVAPSVNEPPATPRDDMWAAIISAQQAAPAASMPPAWRRHARRWMLPAAVAAAAIMGVAIDRLVVRGTSMDPAQSPPAAPAVASAPASPADGGLYRVAAQQTLGQAEALLVAYRGSSVREQQRLGAWGRDVLSSTRLLLDSPAGEDPVLRALLEDLELVLVQIVRLSTATPDSTERTMIDRSLREADLLPRIRSTAPASDIVAGSAD